MVTTKVRFLVRVLWSVLMGALAGVAPAHAFQAKIHSWAIRGITKPSH
jgi:hypothetical protein